MSSSGLFIPPDIIDKIVDYLKCYYISKVIHFDGHITVPWLLQRSAIDLKNLCLVSKAWYLRASRVLHRSLHIDLWELPMYLSYPTRLIPSMREIVVKYGHAPAQYDYYLSPKGSKYDKIRVDFITEMQSLLLLWGSALRLNTLSITGSYQSYPYYGAAYSGYYQFVTSYIALFSKMETIRCLKLDVLNSEFGGSKHNAIFNKEFMKITHLELGITDGHAIFPSPNPLVFRAIMKNARRLRCLRATSGPYYDMSIMPIPSTLRYLELRNVRLDPAIFVSKLRKLCDTGSLTHVIILLPGRPSRGSWKSVFDTLAQMPNLVWCDVDKYSSGFNFHFLDALDTAALLSLELALQERRKQRFEDPAVSRWPQRWQTYFHEDRWGDCYVSV